ncbi:MAG: hydroxymethylglutaryl-CoA reductase, degradative, partial [Anaerolineae bacterium]
MRPEAGAGPRGGWLIDSRIPEFYKLDLEARLSAVQERANLTDEDLAVLRGQPPLSVAEADGLIENVVATAALPLGIAVNFTVDRRDYLIPMAIEEASVVAAASHAAKLVREGGGFVTEAASPVMLGQIQILDVEDAQAAQKRLEEAEPEILQAANAINNTIRSLGGGARGLQLESYERTETGPMILLGLLYDVRDAMGANAVNTVLEYISPTVERISGGRINLRIVSNLADRRLVRARAEVPLESLALGDWTGPEVADRIMVAQHLAELDPHRATTHNKGILNGVDAVALATGNDWRAIEAGAHAYAAKDGQYGPLTRWRLHDRRLVGQLEMPMPVGIVGGATRALPTARVALKIL